MTGEVDLDPALVVDNCYMCVIAPSLLLWDHPSGTTGIYLLTIASSSSVSFKSSFRLSSLAALAKDLSVYWPRGPKAKVFLVVVAAHCGRGRDCAHDANRKLNICSELSPSGALLESYLGDIAIGSVWLLGRFA